MKKKNLFLSLISSVLLAVAIVTVTVCSVIKPNKSEDEYNQGNTEVVSDVTEKDYDYINNFERNGSEEYPYIIYSAESFNDLISNFGGKRRVVTRPVKEKIIVDDKIVDSEENKLDEEGHFIFEEVLDEQGKKIYDVYHFEFVNDIDFSGVNYKTLFNNEYRFIGQIHGNNFSLKNVSINVTKDNLVSDFANSFNAKQRYAHIALFGDIDGAVIENIKIDNLNVNLNEDVFDYINDAEYDFGGGEFTEVVVGGIAGFAYNSKLSNVDLDAKINGSNYVLNTNGFYNAIGGAFAVTSNCDIVNSNINVDIVANAGENYFVGGVAGYGFKTRVLNTNVNAIVTENYAMNLKTAGVFAYAQNVSLSKMQVNLVVKEQNESSREAYVNSLLNAEVISSVSNQFTTVRDVDGNSLSKVAGVVCILEVTKADEISIISNVNVTSDVDFDCIFAGVVLDIYSVNPTNKTLVSISDVIVSSDINVLIAHGFARQLESATVSYGNHETEGYYNVKITGNVKLVDSYVLHDENDEIICGKDGKAVSYHAFTLITNSSVTYYSAPSSNFYVVVSSSINNYISSNKTIRACETLKLGMFASYKFN